MEIIPAIDIIDGACVRLTKGDYSTKKIYSQDPLETAKQYEDAGIRRLHVVDLDGAKAGTIRNYAVLERIAGHTSLVVDFGGGISSDDDIRAAFESGAKMVTGGSVAVRNPETFMEWLQRYGRDRLILGADARSRRIAVSGWSEESQQDVAEFIQGYLRRGVKMVISTDIGRDGMMEGPALELYREILNRAETDSTPIHLIASGGVSGESDLEALREFGLHGVIIGKALYEGRITLKVLQKWAE